MLSEGYDLGWEWVDEMVPAGVIDLAHLVVVAKSEAARHQSTGSFADFALWRNEFFHGALDNMIERRWVANPGSYE
jgi:hypothetical protein